MIPTLPFLLLSSSSRTDQIFLPLIAVPTSLASALPDGTLGGPVPRHPDRSASDYLPCPEPLALLAASQPLKPVAAQPPCSCFPMLSALMHTNRLNHPPALTRSLHPPLHLPANLNLPHPSSPPPLLPFAPSHLPLTAAPQNNHLSPACLIVSVFTHPMPSPLQSALPDFRATRTRSCSRASARQPAGRPPASLSPSTSCPDGHTHNSTLLPPLARRTLSPALVHPQLPLHPNFGPLLPPTLLYIPPFSFSSPSRLFYRIPAAF